MTLRKWGMRVVRVKSMRVTRNFGDKRNILSYSGVKLYIFIHIPAIYLYIYLHILQHQLGKLLASRVNLDCMQSASSLI